MVNVPAGNASLIEAAGGPARKPKLKAEATTCWDSSLSSPTNKLEHTVNDVFRGIRWPLKMDGPKRIVWPQKH